MTGNVLIGGGTGFIGTHLINALKSKGYTVKVVSRMPGPINISWNDVNTLGLCNNTVAVVNLAGQNVMDFNRRWTPGFKQNVFNSRINTTANLARAIDKANVKPKVFISMSGVGAYKPDNQIEYDESSPVTEFDFFSKLVIAWEEAAKLQNLLNTKCRVVNIRSGVVLGKNGGMINQIYLPFSLGLGGPIGSGSQFFPWIHIQDLVNLIVYSIENNKVDGILNGVAPNPCTNSEFTKAFANALNRPAFIPVPSFVFGFLLGTDRAKMITEGQRVIPRRVQELGFKFKYPTIQHACEQIVQS